MWMTTPKTAGPNSKWKGLPAMPSSIEAIIVFGEAQSEAMWYSGVKNPAPLAQPAIMAYAAMTTEARIPAPAPTRTPRPKLVVLAVVVRVMVDSLGEEIGSWWRL